LIRSCTAAEFPGITFHEVAAKSALNRVVEGSSMPFRWTVNPYRGCTHACVYCYARGTHTWLDLDPGAGFDQEIVVKVNVVEVLRRELRAPGWHQAPVALGTNTDPYQRAEGRYRLMPGVIDALAASGTPFSILTKGTLVRRDLPLLVEAARQVPVGLALSVALWDEELRRTLEPGAPSLAARLEAVAEIREAGLPCAVFVAPVLPWLTDGEDQLAQLLGRIKATGATGVQIFPLHLRAGVRAWFMQWLQREHPELLPRYNQLYRTANPSVQYRRWLADRVRPIRARLGWPAEPPERFPDGSLPRVVEQGVEAPAPAPVSGPVPGLVSGPARMPAPMPAPLPAPMPARGPGCQSGDQLTLL